jgi:hypothetical protein
VNIRKDKLSGEVIEPQKDKDGFLSLKLQQNCLYRRTKKLLNIHILNLWITFRSKRKDSKRENKRSLWILTLEIQRETKIMSKENSQGRINSRPN